MKRNIAIAYFLTFLRYSWFWLGIWIFYYLKFTNYAGIGLIETVQIITITIGEVPTGAIADLFGKQLTLTVSFVLQAVGMFCLAFATNSNWLIVGVLIAGLGGAFYSGTLDALLYDSLGELHEGEKFSKVISHTTSLSMIAPALCGVIGGFLYLLQPNLPFLIHALFYTVGIPFTFFLTEPKTVKNQMTNINTFLKQMKQGFIELFKTSFLIEQTCILVASGAVSVICLEMLNDFLGVEFGFKPTSLAITWAILYVICAGASYSTPYIGKYLSNKSFVLILGSIIAVSLMISPIAGFGGIILGGFTLLIRSSAQAMYGNVSSVLVNEHIDTAYRTTTLSAFNLLKNIPYVLGAYALGVIADKYSAITLAFFLGLALFIIVAIQSVFYLRAVRST